MRRDRLDIGAASLICFGIAVLGLWILSQINGCGMSSDREPGSITGIYGKWDQVTGDFWIAKIRQPTPAYDTYLGQKPWLILVFSQTDPSLSSGPYGEQRGEMWAFWCDGPGQQCYPARYHRDYSQPGGPWVPYTLPHFTYRVTVLSLQAGPRVTLTSEWD